MALRGCELDTRIEQELQLMLAEGFDKSPISNKLLHARLSSKNIVSGSLSTLSSIGRKKLISEYKDLQLERAEIPTQARQNILNKRTREAFKDQLINKKDEIKLLQAQLDKNTSVLIDIIKAVDTQTTVKVEQLLSEHLIVEMHKNKTK